MLLEPEERSGSVVAAAEELYRGARLRQAPEEGRPIARDLLVLSVVRHEQRAVRTMRK